MSTSIGINPNLRLGDGNVTVADLEEDVLGDPPVKEAEVQVRVDRAGLVGRGWVENVDESEGTVLVRVAWGSLRRSSQIGFAAVRTFHGSNLTWPQAPHRTVA